MMGGKGSKGQQQQIQLPQSNVSFSSLTPNPAAMPGYGWLAGNMQNLMQQPMPYFPGQTYVSPSGLTQQAVDQQKAMMGQAAGNYGFLSNAANVANNPYVQGMMQANERSATDWMQNKALPSIQSGALGVNALGSDRMGLAQGTAAAEAQKNLLNQNAQTQMQAYQAGLGAQQGALGQTGNLMQSMLQPGQTVEGYQQAALQDQMNRFNYMFQEPWQRMQNIQGVLGALQPLGVQQGGGMGVGSSVNPNYMSPMQGAFGGAMTGWDLGGKLGGAFNTGKAPGTQQQQMLNAQWPGSA
jgi:hypothetical protein